MTNKDDYDDYKINSRSDLFRFIELKLREVKDVSSLIKKAKDQNKKLGTNFNVEKMLLNSYDEAKGYAISLREADPTLIKLPSKGLDNQQNLINIREWCINAQNQNQQVTTTEDIIIIDPDKFSEGKTWQLLSAIISDNRSKGVPCEKRTLRTLKERLKKVVTNSEKENYIKLAKSLEYKDGKARTIIPFGKIIISPKK